MNSYPQIISKHTGSPFTSPFSNNLCRILLIALLASISACSTKVDSQNITYWTAPSLELSRFEKIIVDEWNNSHPDSPIDWKTIPAGISSEEVLLTAIATKTGPDICANIFGGFASQLADAGVIVALDTLPGFWDLVEKRHMTKIIRNNWYYKGHVYVLPVYTNPEMIWYNKEILNAFNITVIPRTYSEFFAILDVVCSASDMYGLHIDVSSKWYRRWFDYLTFYAAASGGSPYLDMDNKAAFFNQEAGIAVTTFFHKLFAKGYAPKFEIQDGFQKGLFVAAIKGAGDIVRTKRIYPELQYHIAPLLVPDNYPADSPIYTLAESKGMVLFNSTAKKAQAWDFMRHYFTDEHDSLWLAITNYLPVREDLLSNSIFKLYFEDNPEIKRYAVTTAFSVPLSITPHTVQIQTILNRELWQPIIYGLKSPLAASRDANSAINRILRSGP
ncbi:MAG: extracellular solute-binding protein [Candidatus Marinimicrobia bacterium]|nr:extracellular solute-binding protein [Candidatus Neomarinimicrobiota bacterium]